MPCRPREAPGRVLARRLPGLAARGPGDKIVPCQIRHSRSSSSSTPFCLCGRDLEQLSSLCGRCGADLRVINLWDLDDEEVDTLPGHLATFIRERRSGRRPGSVYGDAFIAGRRFHLDGWSEQHVSRMEQWLRQCGREAAQ